MYINFNFFINLIGGNMLKKGSVKAIAVTMAIAAASFGFSGCASKITEEQLATLRDLRGKERSLNESIQMKRDEISRLQRELETRKGELKECNDRKAYLEAKLQTWPNCWPQ